MSQLGRYAHIWSCTFGYKAVLSNLIYGHKWGMPSPNMGILYSYDISNLHIWAQGYGHKWGMPKYGSYMATNEACPNMGILHSYDISNLHIWAQKGQWDMPKYGVLIWSSHSALWCHNCQLTSLTADTVCPNMETHRFPTGGPRTTGVFFLLELLLKGTHMKQSPLQSSGWVVRQNSLSLQQKQWNVCYLLQQPTFVRVVFPLWLMWRISTGLGWSQRMTWDFCSWYIEMWQNCCASCQMISLLFTDNKMLRKLDLFCPAHECSLW